MVDCWTPVTRIGALFDAVEAVDRRRTHEGCLTRIAARNPEDATNYFIGRHGGPA